MIVPAGSFSAFKVLFAGAGFKEAYWFSPLWGIRVKTDGEKLPNRPAGPSGLWITELKSYTLP